MMRHIAYLKYVLRHKKFVWQGGRKLGVNWWQLLTHDWSKFLPSEWIPYARTFYNEDGSERKEGKSKEFTLAWLHHQNRQPHHWQHWMITYDEGNFECVEMPEKYVREMVADWYGAGMAITGKNDTIGWYYTNQRKIALHERTRNLVELILQELI